MPSKRKHCVTYKKIKKNQTWKLLDWHDIDSLKFPDSTRIILHHSRYTVFIPFGYEMKADEGSGQGASLFRYHEEWSQTLSPHQVPHAHWEDRGEPPHHRILQDSRAHPRRFSR
jgi:hypothetical protein